MYTSACMCVHRASSDILNSIKMFVLKSLSHVWLMITWTMRVEGWK